MKRILFLATAVVFSVTACKKETSKPTVKAESPVYSDKVSVTDDKGVITYTYEISSTDQKQLNEAKLRLEKMKLVSVLSPSEDENLNEMNNIEDNSLVTYKLDISYEKDFFKVYKEYSGKHIGFGLTEKGISKTYQLVINASNVSEITSGGLSRILFFNQTYYFNLGCLCYARNCHFYGYKNGSSTAYQTWNLGLGSAVTSSVDAFGTPLNDITKFRATTIFWTAPGPDQGKMNVLAEVWIP